MLIKNDGDTCFQISLLPVYLDKYSATGLFDKMKIIFVSLLCQDPVFLLQLMSLRGKEGVIILFSLHILIFLQLKLLIDTVIDENEIKY